MIFSIYTIFDLETSSFDKNRDLVEPIEYDANKRLIMAVILRVFILLFTTYFFVIEVIQFN
jgi:hypothetical protein